MKTIELSKREIEAILAALDEAPPVSMSVSGRGALTKKLRAALDGPKLFSAEEAIAQGWVKPARWRHSFKGGE